MLKTKRRNELSADERKPDCILGIKQLKRKEISCYKPSDLWTQEDDLVFLKWVTNERDRCYHTMARDLSATAWGIESTESIRTTKKASFQSY